MEGIPPRREIVMVNTQIIDIRGQKPIEELNQYLLVTGNFFPLVRWDSFLLMLDEVRAQLDRLGVLLESFSEDWRLSQHAVVVKGQLVAAVVRAQQAMLFGGECFPHKDFHEHATRVSAYLGSLADLSEHPKCPERQLRHHDSKRRAFPVEPDSRTVRRLKSLARAKAGSMSVETGDGQKSDITLPARGRLARDPNSGEAAGDRMPRLRISKIESVSLVHLADGSIATTSPLSPQAIDGAMYLEHDAGLMPSRKVVWEGKSMRFLKSDQMPLALEPHRKEDVGAN